jgi:hypothetical protein
MGSPIIHVFLRDESQPESMEEARLAMVSLKVWRQDGARHVQLEGEWENVIAALLDCDALIVTVNETRPATDA